MGHSFWEHPGLQLGATALQLAEDGDSEKKEDASNLYATRTSLCANMP